MRNYTLDQDAGIKESISNLVYKFGSYRIMSTVKALVNRLRNRIFQFRVGPEALSHKNVWFAWSMGVGVIPDDDVTKPLIVSVGRPSQVLDVSDVHKNIGVEVCAAKCGKAVFVVGAQEYGNTTSLTDLAL